MLTTPRFVHVSDLPSEPTLQIPAYLATARNPRLRQYKREVKLFLETMRIRHIMSDDVLH